MSIPSCTICGRASISGSSCCAVAGAAAAGPLSAGFIRASETGAGAQLVRQQLADVHGDAGARALLRQALGGRGLGPTTERDVSVRLASGLASWTGGPARGAPSSSGSLPEAEAEQAPPEQTSGEGNQKRDPVKAAPAAPPPKPPPTERDLGDIKAFLEGMDAAQDEGADTVPMDAPGSKK